jgi:MFS family permease
VTGLGRYRALLAIRGVRTPLVASTLGSVPIGMYGLAILLLVRDTGRSYGEAGLLVGAFSLANALGAVAQGRLMDRFGQTGVLRAAATVHLPTLIALVLATRADAPLPVLALLALCGGASLPQLPAAMRSLWNTLVPDLELRTAAYALVAVVFELAVVTAPALVAAIAAVASAQVAVLAAGAVAVGSALSFSVTGASRAWRGVRHEAGWLGPLAAPGMWTVFLALMGFGAAFGIVQVAVPAFADARGAAETGGVLLAALPAGSLMGGLLYGARTWAGTLPVRFAGLLLGVAGAYALVAVADSYAVLVVLLFLCGLLFAPTTVAASTLLDTVAPRGTVTEAFAVMVMGIVAGTALGNALGGTLVENASFAVAALAGAAIVAAGAVFAFARRRTLQATPS